MLKIKKERTENEKNAVNHDFLYPDYFLNRWEKNMDRMNSTMKEMDSLKNLFSGLCYGFC
ncbi:MAG TPA: hypothetical protein ENH02_01785 [Bacteroidetes bacterium]|nr:hypothetical protein [Bacteroidota bacterium]